MGQICSSTSKPTPSPPASPRFTRLSSPRASISREPTDARQTLLSTCVGAVASGCERLDVASLPHDLAQLVFERLQEAGHATMCLLRRFHPGALDRAAFDLWGEVLDDAWLAQLGRQSRLRELLMPNCTLVRGDRLHLWPCQPCEV